MSLCLSWPLLASDWGQYLTGRGVKECWTVLMSGMKIINLEKKLTNIVRFPEQNLPPLACESVDHQEVLNHDDDQ